VRADSCLETHKMSTLSILGLVGVAFIAGILFGAFVVALCVTAGGK
jgi:hypothetical protein